jgi:hypothetical protein
MLRIDVHCAFLSSPYVMAKHRSGKQNTEFELCAEGGTLPPRPAEAGAYGNNENKRVDEWAGNRNNGDFGPLFCPRAWLEMVN